MKKEAEAVPKLTTQNEELSAKLLQMEQDKNLLSEQLKETQTKLDGKSAELTEVQETLKVQYVCTSEDVGLCAWLFVLVGEGGGREYLVTAKFYHALHKECKKICNCLQIYFYI